MTSISDTERLKWIGSTDAASFFSHLTDDEGSSQIGCMFDPVPDGWHIAGCVGYTNGFRVLKSKHTGEPIPFEPNDYTVAGVELEDGIARVAEWKFDITLKDDPDFHQHKYLDGFGVSVDKDDGKTHNEIKCVGLNVFKRDWVVEGRDIIDVPLNYLLQGQAQLACTGREAMHYIVMADRLVYRGQVLRHEPTISRIEHACKEFWRVQDWQAYDQWDVGRDANLSSQHGKDVIQIDDPALVQRVAEYQDALADKKAKEQVIDEFKADLEVAMQGHAYANLGHHPVTWPIITSEEKEITYVRKAKTYRGGLKIK